MPIPNEELLRKATLTTADFGGPGEAPLTIEQAREFMRLAITPQKLLPLVREVSSNAAIWQESKIDFSSRILRPGVEATRLGDPDRVKPSTGVVEMRTVLVRGEVPISDEVFEDQVEQARFGETVAAMVAEAVGRDLEELMIQGDTASADPYLALLDGWLKRAQGAGGNVYNAVADGQDYQRIFGMLLRSIPDRFKRSLDQFKYFVPARMVEKYRDILAARGTPLGDLMLTGNGKVTYQGIEIVGVPLFPITSGTPDRSYVLLTNPKNLYLGWHRRIKMETYRDPREGATSFIVTARVASQIAEVAAMAIATNVDVEP